MTDFVQTLIDGASLGSLYALLALGVALVFGVMSLVNFAHGELLMIGGYTFFLLAGGLPWVVVAVIVVVVVALSAVAMERVAFRPLRRADAATMLVAAFAVSYLLQSIAQFVFGSRSKPLSVSSFFDESVTIAGLRVAAADLLVMAVTAVLLVGLVLFLRRSPIGVQMRAAAEDFQMARLLGVRANRVIAVAFAVSGVFAGVAAVLYLGQTGLLTPTLGLAPVLVAFVATVMGGMGTLSGSALGGFLLGFLSVLLQRYLPEDLRPFRDAFVFAAVIGVLLVRPQGLLASRAGVARV